MIRLANAHSILSEISGITTIVTLLTQATISQYALFEILQLMSLCSFLNIEYLLKLRQRYLLDLKWQRLDAFAYSNASDNTLLSFLGVEGPEYARLLSMILSLLLIFLGFLLMLFAKLTKDSVKPPKIKRVLEKLALIFGWRFPFMMFNLFSVGHLCFIMIEFFSLDSSFPYKPAYLIAIPSKVWASLLALIHACYFALIAYLCLTSKWIKKPSFKGLLFLFEDYSFSTSAKKIFPVLLLLRRVLFSIFLLMPIELAKAKVLAVLILQALFLTYYVNQPFYRLTRLITQVFFEALLIVFILCLYFLTSGIPKDEKVDSTWTIIVLFYIHQSGLILLWVCTFYEVCYSGTKSKELNLVKGQRETAVAKRGKKKKTNQSVPKTPHARKVVSKTESEDSKDKGTVVQGKDSLKSSAVIRKRNISSAEGKKPGKGKSEEISEEVRDLLKSEPSSTHRVDPNEYENLPQGEKDQTSFLESPERTVQGFPTLPFQASVVDSAVVRSHNGVFVLEKGASVTVTKIFEDVGFAEVNCAEGEGLMYLKDLIIKPEQE